MGGWRKQQSRDIQVLGKHALENVIAFGSGRATSGCWSQVSCSSWLCVWNTATWKIYLQVPCLYGQIIFYNYPYSSKEKNPRSASDDHAAHPLSHKASSPSSEADIQVRWAEAAPATAGSSAHSLGWSIDAWMDTSSLPPTKHCAIPLLCMCQLYPFMPLTDRYTKCLVHCALNIGLASTLCTFSFTHTHTNRYWKACNWKPEWTRCWAVSKLQNYIRENRIKTKQPPSERCGLHSTHWSEYSSLPVYVSQGIQSSSSFYIAVAEIKKDQSIALCF